MRNRSGKSFRRSCKLMGRETGAADPCRRSRGPSALAASCGTDSITRCLVFPPRHKAKVRVPPSSPSGGAGLANEGETLYIPSGAD
jgi:hypothetical protein